MVGGHGIAAGRIDVQAKRPNAVREVLELVDELFGGAAEAEKVVNPVADEIIDVNVGAGALGLVLQFPFHPFFPPRKKKGARRS